MNRRRFSVMAGLAVIAGGITSAVAFATPGQVAVQYKAPVTAQFEMFPKVCDNRTSEIDISGELTFPGVGIEVRFQNQDNNLSPGALKHTKEVATTAAMSIYDLQPNTLPKQPARGGVGGNPWIYVQLEDEGGEALGSPILVGRCVMGNSYRSGKYTTYVDADAQAVLSMLSCDQKGAFVDVGAEGGHDGLDATVIFTNNRKFTHATERDATVELGLVRAIHERKGGQVSGGKVTGNPLISARFRDHAGNPLQSYVSLGRCNQLG